MNLKEIYSTRDKWVHKGNFGYVLIVAGGRVYSGSPIFNALAALRAGADLTLIVTHPRTADIVGSFLPDLIARPLDKDLEMKHTQKILTLAKRFDSLIIGGGLARSPQTYQAIREIIQKCSLPMVIDAEAIRAVAEDKKTLRILKEKKAVLTPHIEEFRILTGEEVKPEIKDREEKIKKWAKELGAVILLKGYLDVISDGQEVVLNKTGSPYMTKGGFGDTLAGICGALLARGISPFVSAQVAAFINGRAGELAVQKYGEGVIASDIFEFIPEVITNTRRVDK